MNPATEGTWRATEANDASVERFLTPGSPRAIALMVSAEPIELGEPMCDDGPTSAARRARQAHGARHGGLMSDEKRNMELMQTLDDAWNAQDLDTFAARHTKDVVVRWPGKAPTIGLDAHRAEAIDFFKTFPNQRLGNRPYRVFFASGEWTCSIAHFTGTMTGPTRGPDGNQVMPTGKSFDVDFCTVAHWDETGHIIEENLFYDLVTFMKQIGLG